MPTELKFIFGICLAFIILLFCSIPFMMAYCKREDERINQKLNMFRGRTVESIHKTDGELIISFEGGGYLRATGRKGLTIE